MDRPSSQGSGGADEASKPTAKQPPSPMRKRSTSGTGSILSRLPFMRSTGEHHRPRSRHNVDENERPIRPKSPTSPSSPGASVEMLVSQPVPHIHVLQQQAQQQQQKTRRRRGSLRKVALLGRGAQREKRERESRLSIDTKFQADEGGGAAITGGGGSGGRGGGDNVILSSPSPLGDSDHSVAASFNDSEDGYGLGISDITPRPSMEGYASRPPPSQDCDDLTPTATTAPIMIPQGGATDSTVTSPTMSYSTTDDEDGLHISRPAGGGGGGGIAVGAMRVVGMTPSASSSSLSLPQRPERSSLSSGSESYFHHHTHPRPPGLSSSGGGGGVGVGPASATVAGGLAVHGSGGGAGGLGSIQRRRSATSARAKSPLGLTSLAGLSTTPLPPPDADWDYSETEFWGWVVLVVTWVVFVTGMGSCLGVWSWAWDVGTTPDAPPELSDDHTLPIVGYYPAQMILTGVMAWVWVVAAWVGMKYFRHARVNSD